MHDRELYDLETATSYDKMQPWMFSPEVLEPTVRRLAELAGDGRALEFAIGTGRVAVPLRARGIEVAGIEMAPAMIAELRAKADEADDPRGAGRHGDRRRLPGGSRSSISSTTRSPTCSPRPRRWPASAMRRATCRRAVASRSSSGCRSCASCRRGKVRSSGIRSRAISASTPTTCSPSRSCRTISGSARGARRISIARRTDTSGRPSST